MRRPALVLSIALILGITLIVIIVVYKPSPSSPSLPLPEGAIQQPAGERAIVPTPGKVPAFTKGEVVSYFTTSNHHVLFATTSGPIIVTENDVFFMTSKQVNALINRQNTGIPDNHLLCFVLLHGSFTFYGPPTAQGKPTSITYAMAYEVFDAETGNLLMGGAVGTPVPGTPIPVTPTPGLIP